MGPVVKPTDQPKRTFIEEARRAQIVSCAIDTIAEVGYAQASLAQIAKRAGISKGVISYHFSGKEELVQEAFAAAFDVAEEIMMPMVDAQTTRLGRLRAYILGTVEFIRARPKHLRALIEILEHARDENGRRLAGTDRFERTIRASAEGFAAGIESGELRRFDPYLMAVTVRAAIDAMVGLHAANPDIDLDAYANELIELFERGTRA